MTEICTPIIRQYWIPIRNSTTSHLNANHNESNIWKGNSASQSQPKLNNKKKSEENAKSKSSYFIEKKENRYHAINTEDSRKKIKNFEQKGK